MSNKIIVLSLLVTFVLGAAIGRYTVQAPTTKDEETVISDTNTKTDKDTHKTTVITKDPGGKETTTITEDTTSHKDTTKEVDKKSVETVTPPKTNTVNVSALVAIEPTDSLKPIYGASVSKQLLGPVTVGAFFLTNSTIGLSLGLNF